MTTYEIQLGRINDGARDGNIDYESPQIILIDANHYIKIEEVEDIFKNEILSLNCDCVYGITPLEEWELKEYECYKTIARYKML